MILFCMVRLVEYKQRYLIDSNKCIVKTLLQYCWSADDRGAFFDYLGPGFMVFPSIAFVATYKDVWLPDQVILQDLCLLLYEMYTEDLSVFITTSVFLLLTYSQGRKRFAEVCLGFDSQALVLGHVAPVNKLSMSFRFRYRV